MRIRGPLATLLAVVAAGAAVITTNVVVTAQPSEVQAPAATLSANENGYSTANAPAGAGATAPAGDPAVSPAAPAATPASYDGRTAGDEVTVQVTIENGQAKAYLCNADKGIESWVKGPVQDGKLQLTGDNGTALEGTSDGTAVFGTAHAGGKSWPFAAAVKKDGATAPAQPGTATPSAGTAPAPATPAQPAAPSSDTGYGGY